MVSRGLSDIMSGCRPLPALCITICPDLHRFHAELSRAKIEKEGCHFFFYIHVIARTVAERDKISQECIQTLLQQENNLERGTKTKKGSSPSQKTRVGFTQSSSLNGFRGSNRTRLFLVPELLKIRQSKLYSKISN